MTIIRVALVTAFNEPTSRKARGNTMSGIPEEKYAEVVPIKAAQALASGPPQNTPRIPAAGEIAQLDREVWA